MCFSFIGAGALPREQASAPLTAQAAGGVQAGLRKNGAEVTSVSTLNLYDVVTFGRYPQGAYGEFVDIEWIVIGFDGDNRVKLMSRYALDTHTYHDSKEMVSWTSSALYIWLNSSFRANAFNQEEQSFLSGDISVPSVEEAKALPSTYRKCFSTAYAIGQGGDAIRCIWWLNDKTVRIEREDDQGDKKYYCFASVVNDSGEVAPGAIQANFHGKVIRPTIIVDLNPNAAQERDSALVHRNGKGIFSAYDLRMNDIITFGRYTQSPYAAPTDIEWIVVGFDGNRVKLVSKYGLDSKRYNESHSMVTWTSSTLYSWLNYTFKFMAFNSIEQQLLANDVTLPNVMDAESLSVANRPCVPTAFAVASGVSDKQCIWWLSEPTDQVKYRNNTRGWCASAVKDNGEIARVAYQINFDGKAVRPMIVLDFSKLY